LLTAIKESPLLAINKNSHKNPKKFKIKILMFKDFAKWIQYKIYLNSKSKFPKFKEGEVWWASFGVNVGIESDGKNNKFNRPVLILKKFNRNQLWAIPMTSKSKPDNEFYYKVTLRGKESYLILSQLRTLDSKRLQDRITKINISEMRKVLKKVQKLLTKK
jgi:mRNA interferase MazF